MKKLKLIISHLPLASLLLSWSFVLDLFVANIGQAQLKMLVVPLLVVTLLALVIWAISSLLLRDNLRGQIFCSLFLILFLSYAEVLSLFRNVRLPRELLHFGRNNLVFLILALISLLFFFLVKKIVNRRFAFNQFLTVVALISLVFPLLRLGQFEMTQAQHTTPTSPMEIPRVETAKLTDLPDIYYIVPEDYSAAKIYQQYFNSDISDFLTFLRQKGFYVAEGSTSNYPKSFLSIGSALNMEYLDYLSKYKNSSNQTIVNSLIENNNVMKFLQTLGYKYYQMGSWWDPTRYNPFADDNFTLERKHLDGINQFDYALLDSTMMNPVINELLPKVVIGESDTDKRARILYQFAQLPVVAKLPGPKFVFTHIIAPHEPYVFGKNCEFLTYKQTRKNPEEENYANQTICLNKKLEETITSIIGNASRPPIIIIQTDEGAPFLGSKVTPADNWKTASDDLLREKFPIMAAYYLPTVATKSLYPSITPVNSFRLIFNLYFSTHLPLLPDKNYIFPDLNHLYDFKDVTQIVQKNE